jgi:hypothetical protein
MRELPPRTTSYQLRDRERDTAAAAFDAMCAARPLKPPSAQQLPQRTTSAARVDALKALQRGEHRTVVPVHFGGGRAIASRFAA